MSDIKERLDKVRALIQEPEFLEGKGLSNEVNIRMFCYNVKEEMAVRYFTEHLSNDDLTCSVQIVDLYETFLSICEGNRILDRIPKLEERKGKEYLEKQLGKTCDADTFAKEIIKAREDAPFISQEDLQKRGKVNGSSIEKLKALGCLDVLSESNQLSLF